MATVRNSESTLEGDIQPYRMHVSARYLDLTKRKLELTRLPREVDLPSERSWALGTPKSTLEPLIDFWLDKYSWREQESILNQDLPQYRTIVNYDLDNNTGESESLRIHFVHKQSSALQAIPLLYCHSWPGSFIEASKIIGPLTSPIPTHLHSADDSPSFHVVVPSIPGFGFSDASKLEGFGLKETAKVFDALMKKMGYDKYLVHGSGSGFHIARMLSIHHPNHCVAIHTVSPPTPSPSFTINKSTYLKYQLSKLTGARISWLSFGYTPSDLNTSTPSTPQTALVSKTPYHYNTLPQTTAYSLCDSPSGLLATLLDTLHDSSHSHNWSQTDILNWTMILWLPGPEAGLRWLHAASKEDAFAEWSSVPLGISAYYPPVDSPGDNTSTVNSQPNTHTNSHLTPPMWLESVQRVAWVKRSYGSAGLAAWDAPSDIILDLRQFCAAGRREGWLQLNDDSQALETVHADGNEQLRQVARVPGYKHWFKWKWPLFISF